MTGVQTCALPIWTVGISGNQWVETYVYGTYGPTGPTGATGSAGPANITVGTTTLTGGTNARVIYDNSGVVGEYTVTGSAGSVVLSTSPTITGLTTAAGTASVAPINMTSGTNLTTATSGGVEFDGTALYFTPFGTSRGPVPAEQIVIIGSGGRTLANNTNEIGRAHV